MSWRTTTIGENCTVTSSKRFHLSERSESGVPFYCSKEIIQKYRGEEITECDYIREEFYLDVAKRFGVPQENDLLVTTRGTIGIPYLYRSDDRFYFADGNLTWIKDFKETLLPQFLYYWFLTHEGQKKVDAIAKGTAQKAVPIAGIKTLELNLPDITTQHKVVEILSSYDALIENNQKQIKLLEEAAQRLYKEWFVALRFPGRETTPITDGIPEGWKCEAIDDVYSIKYGKTLPTTKINTTDKYPVYGASKVLGYYSEKNCENYAILITSRGNAGVVHRTHHKESFVTNNSFIVMTQNEKLHNAFIYFQMQQLNFKSIVTGACQQQLTNNLISQKKVVIPSTSILEMFNAIADPLFERIEAIIAQNSNLAEARDRLLPKLMNGEIEV